MTFCISVGFFSPHDNMCLPVRYCDCQVSGESNFQSDSWKTCPEANKKHQFARDAFTDIVKGLPAWREPCCHSNQIEMLQKSLSHITGPTA